MSTFYSAVNGTQVFMHASTHCFIILSMYIMNFHHFHHQLPLFILFHLPLTPFFSTNSLPSSMSFYCGLWMGDLSGAIWHSLPQQLITPIVPQGGMGLHDGGMKPIHDGMLTSPILYQSCAQNHNFCAFTSAIILCIRKSTVTPYLKDTVLQHVSPLESSYIAFTPTSVTLHCHWAP